MLWLLDNQIPCSYSCGLCV